MFSHDAPFSVTASHQVGLLTLHLAGELDVATAPMLRQALDELAVPPLRGITLDLEHLTFVDLLGIRALVDARTTAIAAGAHFTLRSADERILRVIRLVGPPTLEDAVLAVPATGPVGPPALRRSARADPAG